MHVLRSLCGEGLGERLFELRRRVCSKASQTDKELEGRQLPRRLSGQHQGETPTNRSEGPHTICSRTQNYHAGETIAVPDPSKLDGLLLRKWRCCRSSCARRARLQMLPPSSLGITQGWGLMMSYCARLSHPPPTGTPRRAKNPVEGLPMLSSPLVKGVVEVALYCAHRTNTVSPCAFCEQEGHLAAPSYSSEVARCASTEDQPCPYSHPVKLAHLFPGEWHPCWFHCGRRARLFLGRAFREQGISTGVIPSHFLGKPLLCIA